jgi:hypothetical protein
VQRTYVVFEPDGLDDDKFPEVRDAAAVELATFDDEVSVSDPDSNLLVDTTYVVEGNECEAVVEKDADVVDSDNRVVLPEGSLDLMNEEKEEEEFNE